MRVHLMSGGQGGREVGTWERDHFTSLAARSRDRRHVLVESPDEADVILLVDVFFNHRFARVLARKDVRRLVGRLYVYSERALCSGVLPGLLTGLPRRPWDGTRYRTAAYALHDARNPNAFLDEAAASGEPELLGSFEGRPSHAVRRRLLACRFGPRFVVRDTSDYSHWRPDQPDRERHQRDYARTLARSKFVICPRGWSPSSIRLYETMRIGRAPVVIADAWRPPFGPDWERFALFVRERDVTRLEEILSEREAEAEERGRLAREAWEEYFAPETTFDSLVDALEDLHSRRGAERLWQLAWPAHLARMSVHAFGYGVGRWYAGMASRRRRQRS